MVSSHVIKNWIIVLMWGVAFIPLSCDKENPEPICTIVSPTNGSEIVRGVPVSIELQGTDHADALKIVWLYINDLAAASSQTLPFVYTWNTDTLIPGSYTIKAVTIDHQDLRKETSVTTNLKTLTPIVEIIEIINITNQDAVCRCEITHTGEAETIARGVCWNETGSPTVNDRKATDLSMGGAAGTSEFICTLTALDPEKNYFVRGWATNSYGTDYSREKSFKTRLNETGTITDARDGKTYKTVKIGSQWWMAQNLAYLPEVSPPSEGNYLDAIPKFYVYNYHGTSATEAKETEAYKTYGALYNWYAAMGTASNQTQQLYPVRGICPEGWHLPEDDEWEMLSDYMIANGYNYDNATFGNKIGKSLAAQTHWMVSATNHAIGNEPSQNNRSGFTALPGGMRNALGAFYGIQIIGHWWSSSPETDYYSWKRSLYYDQLYNDPAWFYRDKSVNDAGISVRCIKN